MTGPTPTPRSSPNPTPEHVADDATERLRRAVAEHDRAVADGTVAAEEAGVAAADPALMEARRRELAAVRVQAEAWTRAEDHAASAWVRAEAAEAKLDQAVARRTEAEAAANHARTTWREELTGWATGSPWLDADGLARLSSSVDAVGEPGCLAPAQVLAALAQPHRDLLVEARRDNEGRRRATAEEAAELSTPARRRRGGARRRPACSPRAETAGAADRCTAVATRRLPPLGSRTRPRGRRVRTPRFRPARRVGYP